MPIVSASSQSIAVATKVASLTALIAPHVGVEALSIAASCPRPSPAASDPAIADNAAIHLLDRVLRIALVLVDNEGKAGRILSQPELSILSKLFEGSLQLLLAAVDA